ncbi:MAG: ABC transporter ATP-binding protein [Bacillota bacterium]|nr:ABC transporter ATP-binding protein [Bacillota bacterium]
MSETGYIFECRELSKSYSGTQALSDVSLSIESGRIVGLLGPNGSGKTTLIKLANGLLVPNSGEILIEGDRPGISTKTKVAYLPDRDFLPDYMSVAQLMEFYNDFFDDFDTGKTIEMLKNLDIDINSKIKKLSKGTKEKVQLILTMGRNAKVYLLDEPIAGVDPAARDYIIRTIISNYNPEGLVLISTHLIADVEPALDEIIFLKDGRVVLHEEADKVREEKGMSIDGLFREVYRC